MKTSIRGFAIVELLIVIVVIALLAAISVVAYSGIQNRAKDSQMRSGVAQIERALMIWYSDVGEYPKGGYASTQAVGSNGNCADGFGGWFVGGGVTSYQCTIEDALRTKGLLPANFAFNLPNNPYYGVTITDGRYGTMFYPCNDPGEYALYWTLRAPTEEDAASLAYVESRGCSFAPRVNYGQKAAKLIQF